MITKSYEGTHADRHAHVYVVEYDGERRGAFRPLEPRFDWRNHSPSGFEWGYGGSGPSQLALAILADFMGTIHKADVLAVYQDFKNEFIATATSSHPLLVTQEQIEGFLRKKGVAPWAMN